MILIHAYLSREELNHFELGRESTMTTWTLEPFTKAYLGLWIDISTCVLICTLGVLFLRALHSFTANTQERKPIFPPSPTLGCWDLPLLEQKSGEISIAIQAKKNVESVETYTEKPDY